MKLVTIVIALILSVSLAFAASGEKVASDLGLNAGSKAIKQWERVFQKPKKMAKYGIDKLSDGDKEALKSYLVGHAADSDHPAAAGL
jgi:hypothetical protein